jgi:hypothetical protein
VNKIIASIYDETLLQTVINGVIGIDVLVVHSELYITNQSGTPIPHVFHRAALGMANPTSSSDSSYQCS